MKQFLNRVSWVILPLLSLCVLEAAARTRARRSWYEEAADKAGVEKVQAIFVGSSRVAATIDSETVEAELALRQRRQGRILNLGMGYSTLHEHYLGLRNLWARYPSALDGCTVFVGIPLGLPESGTWAQSWHGTFPEMLVPLLQGQDVPRFWMSAASFENKARLTAGYLLRRSRLWRGRKEWRARFLTSAREVLVGAAKTRRREKELVEKGGIRTDTSAVEKVRQEAVRIAQDRMRSQQPIRNWDASVLHDLVNLVREEGGEIIFVHLPLSSVQAKEFETDIRQEDIKNFAEQARKWNVRVLDVGLVFSDGDFPDLWHLSKSRAEEFSRKLTKEWMDAHPQE